MKMDNIPLYKHYYFLFSYDKQRFRKRAVSNKVCLTNNH